MIIGVNRATDTPSHSTQVSDVFHDLTWALGHLKHNSHKLLRTYPTDPTLQARQRMWTRIKPQLCSYNPVHRTALLGEHCPGASFSPCLDTYLAAVTGHSRDLETQGSG